MDSAEKKIDGTMEEKMDGTMEKKLDEGGNGEKHHIPDRYVRLILALPTEEPVDPTGDAALAKRIYDGFVPFQNRVRQEWQDKGYVEVDHDYAARIARAQERGIAHWEEIKKKRDLSVISFTHRDDPVYADFYDAPFDPEEEAVEQAAVRD